MTMLNTEIAYNEIRELDGNEMPRITGGTFTPNTYRKAGYHMVGISTSYHFFDKDEFTFMGRSISYDQANDIVKLANRVMDVMNTGVRGANKVNTTDAAFIRAFNSQLNLKYGIQWDGVPGYDY